MRANTGLELARVLEVLLELPGSASLPLDIAVINVGLHYPAQKFDTYRRDVQTVVDFIAQNQARIVAVFMLTMILILS